MKNLQNEHLRRAARTADVRLYEIATQLSISEATLQRWLRGPLSREKECAILAAIKKIAKEAC